jgi:Predicted nucleotide-binding protein containing TIR-like domain
LKPPVFIASSTEGLYLAYAVQRNLERCATPTVWSQGVFQPSSFVLDQLIQSLEIFKFGVFVFSPDDIVRMRGQEHSAPRDNVVFELGLFIGRRGRERNFVIVPRSQRDLRLPTDLLGLIPAEYDDTRPSAEYVAALGPACYDIEKAIRSAVHADSSGADPRHQKTDILYSSRNIPQITDFVHYGATRYFGEGHDEPLGAGKLRIEEGILVIERTNAVGRFVVELRQYQIGDHIRDYISRHNFSAGQRVLRMTCDVRSTNGKHEIIWVIKQKDRGDRFSEHREIVNTMEWKAVDAVFRLPSSEDCYLRFEDQELTDQNSSLHIRNLILSEAKS